jgi:hypothetical protein
LSPRLQRRQPRRHPVSPDFRGTPECPACKGRAFCAQ